MGVSAWAGAGSLYSDAITLACGHEVGCDEIGDKCRHCEAEAFIASLAASTVVCIARETVFDFEFGEGGKIYVTAAGSR